MISDNYVIIQGIYDLFTGFIYFYNYMNFSITLFTAKVHYVWNFSCFCSWLILPIIDLFWISVNYPYWRIFIFILSWELHFSIILCFVIIISFWLCRYLNRFKYVQHPKNKTKKDAYLSHNKSNQTGEISPIDND